MKVKGSEIVMSIEIDLCIVRLSEEPLMPFQKALANEHIKTLEKMLETRHVLVEKDFTKIRKNKSGKCNTFK